MSKITCLSVIVECLFFGGFAGAADSTTSWRREWEKTLEGAKIPQHRTSRMAFIVVEGFLFASGAATLESGVLS